MTEVLFKSVDACTNFVSFSLKKVMTNSSSDNFQLPQRLVLFYRGRISLAYSAAPPYLRLYLYNNHTRRSYHFGSEATSFLGSFVMLSSFPIFKHFCGLVLVHFPHTSKIIETDLANIVSIPEPTPRHLKAFLCPCPRAPSF